jgi:hypothetical protein
MGYYITDRYSVALKLMQCFPKSFINYRGEFIAHARSNTYLVLDSCVCDGDVECKVLEWFSRSAYKTQTYDSTAANRKFHQFMLDGINQFLGTAFSFDDMELIYTYLGNAVNHDLTVRFVLSGYNLDLLREYAKEKEERRHARD